MNRKTIILLSILLAAILVITSVVFTVYISWIVAKKNELNRLSTYAQQITTRISKSLAEVSETLKILQTLKFSPCSTQQIEKMQEIVFNSRIVEEIDYFENGLLKCNSWGVVNHEVRMNKADFSQNGIELVLDAKSLVSPNKVVIGVRYNNYKALIDPIHFQDIIADPEIQVDVVLHSGKLMAQFNSSKIKTISQNNLVYVLNNKLYKIIVSESKENIRIRLYEELMIFAPFGLLMSISVIGIVIWISTRRLSSLGELKAAINRHEFEVHYQPLIELKTGICIGAEALIRWHRMDGSWERPDVFIDLAEKNNLIEPITDQLMIMIMSDLKDLLHNKQFHISVNFAAIDFQTERILKVLNNALLGTNILPSQIWVEATERSLMNTENVLKTLEGIHELGYQIVIDDFGTGYSSLSYLQKLPLDTIKIDKSFIDSVGKDSSTSHVIDHIIKMAKSLNLKIVAEGVEAQGQVDYLIKNEVEYAQGWFYAKAMPLNKFIDFYKQNNR